MTPPLPEGAEWVPGIQSRKWIAAVPAVRLAA